ncbi:MAG: hypothetical protein PHS31_10870, partial [Victivallaceae bacterium]|nr:hypothetical protein [Victivallaceae bacterium]
IMILSLCQIGILKNGSQTISKSIFHCAQELFLRKTGYYTLAKSYNIFIYLLGHKNSISLFVATKTAMLDL